jgi:hypothetical protein
MIDYRQSDKQGQLALQSFKLFLANKKINCIDATRAGQALGYDLVVARKKFEVKSQSYENKIVIEETSMYENDGWINTSTADYLIEVALDGKSFIKLDMAKLKVWYAKNKDCYVLKANEMTNGERGDKWISKFRIIPLSAIKSEVTMSEVQI